MGWKQIGLSSLFWHRGWPILGLSYAVLAENSRISAKNKDTFPWNFAPNSVLVTGILLIATDYHHDWRLLPVWPHWSHNFVYNMTGVTQHVIWVISSELAETLCSNRLLYFSYSMHGWVSLLTQTLENDKILFWFYLHWNGPISQTHQCP